MNTVHSQPVSFFETTGFLFAYGSNMNLKQLAHRCHSAKVLGVARLDHHKIGFYGYSEEWDGALETVEECEGKTVWGALIALNDYDWDSLDQWMDARLDGAGVYFHFPVTVTGSDGKEYVCRIYKKDVLEQPEKPSQPYLNHIIEGATDLHLPQEYIDRLRSIEVKQATYAVPVRCGSDLGTGTAGRGCSECASAAPVVEQKGPLCVLQSI